MKITCKLCDFSLSIDNTKFEEVDERSKDLAEHWAVIHEGETDYPFVEEPGNKREEVFAVIADSFRNTILIFDPKSSYTCRSPEFFLFVNIVTDNIMKVFEKESATDLL